MNEPQKYAELKEARHERPFITRFHFWSTHIFLPRIGKWIDRKQMNDSRLRRGKWRNY